MSFKKVVLAYSGGLDTSVVIPWLKENYDCEVIAMCADVGQGEDLDAAAKKARSIGASKAYVEDLRTDFVRDYVYPAIRAGARYEGSYLLGTSLARPIIAQRQVEIALVEGADALAHGCTGKGNDQVRFELTYQALAPQLEIIAPWRIWNIRSREDALEYAAAHGVPVEQSKENIYSRDQNLLHLSHEGGVLEDPWTPPPENLYQLTASPKSSPDEPDYVEIGFQKGNPCSVDGVELEPVPLIEKLNAIGGAHGVGRLDIVENRLVGMKSRGVYETPGGSILHEAHNALESITLDRATSHFKSTVANRYADVVYDGQWFSPLREALDSFVEATQETVTGDVLVQLFKGSIQAVGRRSPFSLYSEQFATFGEDDVFKQVDAEGFIRLFGLPQKIRHLTQKANQSSVPPGLMKSQKDASMKAES